MKIETSRKQAASKQPTLHGYPVFGWAFGWLLHWSY
jgi:hypothetical protein